jgi:hypothetical protein
MYLRELQARQQRIDALTEELGEYKRFAGADGSGTIVAHARSGVLRRELDDLLAAAATDAGAGEGFRMPSSAFLAQGLTEAMLIAETHRYVHARKARTLKAEEALARAERVISDNAAEIIGLKAQLRELTGKTPRRRKSLESTPARDTSAQPASGSLAVAPDVASKPAMVDVSTSPEGVTEQVRCVRVSRAWRGSGLKRRGLQVPVQQLAMVEHGGDGQTRQRLEQDLKTACAQVCGRGQSSLRLPRFVAKCETIDRFRAFGAG